MAIKRFGNASLVAPIVKLSRQKIVTATVIDVLGEFCSVRLSGRGALLRSLRYQGTAPVAGETVNVDYRSGIPIVITNNDHIAQDIQDAIDQASSSTGGGSAGSSVIPTPAPTDLPTGGAGSSLMVTDDMDNIEGVVQMIFPTGSVEDMGDGVAKITFNAELVMESNVTSPPVPIENSDGDDWVYSG